MNDNLQVIAKPDIFSTPKFVGGILQGSTIDKIVKEIHTRSGTPKSLRKTALVQINGEVVKDWNLIPKHGDNVVVSYRLRGGGGGGGGKNAIATVASLAVVLAAPYAAAAFSSSMALAVYGGGVATAAQVAMVGSVLTAGIAFAGMYAVNALFPARTAKLGGAAGAASYNDSNTYSITGSSNSSNPFGPVPVVLGKHRVFPVYGAKPYTEILGNDEYLRMLFVWGYGRLKIEDIKIGETPIANFAGVEIETREGVAGDAAITLMPNQVLQDSISAGLTASAGWIQRTSRESADELSIDIAFPRGLVEYNASGAREKATVVVEAEYRLVGASTWIELEDFNITETYVGVLRIGKRWAVTRGQYEIRLRRVTADSEDDKLIDEVNWSVMRTFINESPIKFPFPVAITALRIKATEQLSGVIDSLNGIVTSYAPDWDGSDWTEIASQNPASLMRLVLMGNANARKRTAAQIDDASMQEFWNFCNTNGYKFNMVRDSSASVWDTCADICSAARAAPTMIDGKWGVVIDDSTKPVVQYFTPRNSWGFSSKKSLPVLPHAWRVRFVNEDNNYEQDERIVYDDGYNSNNATQFEGLEFPGVTDPDLIWKHGRYHIAQLRLRPEEYTFMVDFEHLVCSRGDLIRVSHDLPMWGLAQARVKTVTEDGGLITQVTVDNEVAMESGKNYVCRFRLDDDTDVLASITLDIGATSTLAFQTGISENIQVGDLAMFGEADSETALLLVKGIKPNADLTATISCVDYAPAIYTCDTGDIPAFETNISAPADITKFPPPVPIIAGVESGTVALEVDATGNFKAMVVLSLLSGDGSPRTSEFEVKYRLLGTAQWTAAKQTAEQRSMKLTEVSDGNEYEIQARAISIYGIPSNWTDTITEVVVGQSELPASVSGFKVSVIGSTAHLSWDANTDIDLSHYVIKWSDLLTGATWDNSIPLIEKIGKPSTSISAPAMAGTYLIKAVDFLDNYSATAAITTTDIVKLLGLNFVEAIEQEDPDFTGTYTDTVYDSALGGIILGAAGDLYDATDLYAIPDLYLYGGIEVEGYFTLADTIDLEGVCTSRVSASLSSAQNDLLSDLYNYEDLYEVSNLYGAREGDTSILIQMRLTQDDPDSSPTWSDWKDLVIGDYTARSFQFRVKFIGKAPSTTPTLYAVYISIDMEDRTVGFGDTIGTGGKRIVFSPAFFVTPEIGISISNGAEGDNYTITNKDETGFDIAFTNGGSAVSRVISGVAKAYGEVA